MEPTPIRDPLSEECDCIDQDDFDILMNHGLGDDCLPTGGFGGNVFNFFGDVYGNINGFKIKGDSTALRETDDEDTPPDLTCPVSQYPAPSPEES